MGSLDAPLRLVVGTRDLTEQHRQLVYSNADPGGLEALTCLPRDPTGLRAGDPVRLTCGLETAWVGTVNDPGDRLQGARGSGTLAALGPGMRLKNGAPAFFVTSDLGQWQRADSFLTAPLTDLPTGLRADNERGLVLSFPKDVTTAANARAAMFLDLGPGLAGKRVVITYEMSPAAPGSSWYLLVRGYDDPSQFTTGTYDSIISVNNPAGGTVAGSAATARRYIGIELYNGSAGTYVNDITARITSVQVFADGAYESADASVLDPADVARWAFQQAGGIVPGEIGDASAYAIQQLGYQTPAPYETMLDDAARMMGWHWGTWEPASVLGDQRPRGFFQQSPAQATCAVQWSDCTAGEAPRVRADLLYDTCRCQYQTVDGAVAFATAYQANPLLPASLAPRILDVNMGVATSGTAQIYAGLALALSQRAARGGGWASLPQVVQTPSGPRPSCLLRSGRDRLRLIGLPDSGNLLETDTRRYDTFHLRRVEVSVDDYGVPRTRVEFDGGGDLMEVLNARLSQPASRAAQIVGGG